MDKFKAIIFDIDGTITEHKSSWQYIHEELGIWDDEAYIYQERFLKGEISYEEFCLLDAIHWKGLKVKKVRELFSKVDYIKNALEVLKRFKTDGYKLAGLSTGLQYIPERLNTDIGFDCILSNKLIDDGEYLTGDVKIHVCDGNKEKEFDTICKFLDVDINEVIFVGDSQGDIGCAKKSTFSIAFNSLCKELDDESDCICRTNDFEEIYTQLLSIQS